MTLAEITDCVKGQLIGADVAISGVSIDSRTLSVGDLYIAISGERFEGHDFIDKAEGAGAIALLVAKKMPTKLAQVIVDDTRIALAELAGRVRDKAQVKVCAITGSNGKTTVKEMIAAILAIKFEVLFTQGNLNNDIGVPLTLMQLDGTQKFAVIEMGANHGGEIAYSSHYAKPDVAVISNVGAAHIEGFGSLEGVAQAKAEIIQSLTDDGVAVLNADDAFFSQWQKISAKRQLISFGIENNASVRAENISMRLAGLQFNTQFDLVNDKQRVPVTLNLAGKHNVLNALAASAACLALGVDVKQIKQGLQQFKAVKGRLQIYESEKGFRLIDDTYNANPASLAVALEVLKACPGELWLALGAFSELGVESTQLHREMAEDMKKTGVKRLFAVGELAEHTVQAFGKGATYYRLQKDLIAALKQEMTPEVVLLVKGSRAQKMEVVVSSLIAKAE